MGADEILLSRRGWRTPDEAVIQRNDGRGHQDRRRAVGRVRASQAQHVTHVLEVGLMRAITPEDRSRFLDDGFVVFDEILSDADVEAVLAASDRIHRGEYTDDRRPPALRKRIDHLGRDQSIRWYLNTRIVDGELWRVT